MSTSLNTGSLAVTATGVAEPLKTAKTLATLVVVQGKAANGGDVHLGGANVHKTTMPGVILDAGDIQAFSAPPGAGLQIDLNLVYVDAGVNGEGVDFVWLS